MRPARVVLGQSKALTTANTVDADGNVLTTTDALGKITQYGYDELGNKTTQTDALSHVTRWGYDALGRATSQRCRTTATRRRPTTRRGA